MFCLRGRWTRQRRCRPSTVKHNCVDMNDGGFLILIPYFFHVKLKLFFVYAADFIRCVTAQVGPVLSSENDVDDANRRVVLVGTNLQLPCTPPDAEGRTFLLS